MPHLLDGTEVAADSDDFLHLCTARAILKLPMLHQRLAWLEDIEHKQGRDAADAMRRTMNAIRDAETAAKLVPLWGPIIEDPPVCLKPSDGTSR